MGGARRKRRNRKRRKEQGKKKDEEVEISKEVATFMFNAKGKILITEVQLIFSPMVIRTWEKKGKKRKIKKRKREKKEKKKSKR